MKITDLRTGRAYVGEHVATIAGNSQPTDEQLENYFSAVPGSPQYAGYKRATTHKRYVLQYAAGKHYVVTVNTKFFMVTK